MTEDWSRDEQDFLNRWVEDPERNHRYALADLIHLVDEKIRVAVAAEKKLCAKRISAAIRSRSGS